MIKKININQDLEFYTHREIYLDSNPRYCTGGRSFFLLTNFGDVFSCHQNYYLKNPIYKFKDKNKSTILKPNNVCSLKCNNPCDQSHIKIKYSKEIKPGDLIRILIHVVDHCPQECAYCFCPLKKSKYIDEKMLDFLLSNLHKIYPTNKFFLMFSGGEPLIHPEIDKLIYFSSKKINSKYIHIYTSLCNYINLKKILYLNNDILNKIYFGISCHPTGKIFNFYSYIKSINLLIEKKINFDVHMVDHKVNEEFKLMFSKIFKSLHVNFNIISDHGIHPNRKNDLTKILNKLHDNLDFFEKI